MAVNQIISRDRSFIDLPIELYGEISTHLPYHDWGTFSEIITLSLRQVDYEQGIDSEEKPFYNAVRLIVLFKNQKLANIALVLATKKANTISIQILLKDGRELLSKQSREIASALAASRGQTETFKNFENKNPDSLKQSFYLAAEGGHVDAVRETLQEVQDLEGFDLNDLDWNQVLGSASINGHIEVVKEILGSDSFRRDVRDESLFYCLQNIFLSSSAGEHLNILEFVVQSDLLTTQLNSQDFGELTKNALKENFLVAVSNKQVGVVKWMLANLPSEFLDTPKAYSMADGNKEILDILKNKTTFFQKIKSKICNFSLSNRIDLQTAALKGDISTVQNLLRSNSISDSDNDDQIEAFHNAACNGHDDVVKVLIEEGNLQPLGYGIGTFSIASERGHATTTDLILKHNPNNEEISAEVLQNALARTTSAEVLRAIMQSKQFEKHLDSFNNSTILTTVDLQRIFSLALTSTDEDFVNNLIGTDPFHLLSEDVVIPTDSKE